MMSRELLTAPIHVLKVSCIIFMMTTCQVSDSQVDWYQRTSILQNTHVDRKQDILNLYHAHSCMINSTDILKDTVFSPVESW